MREKQILFKNKKLSLALKPLQRGRIFLKISSIFSRQATLLLFHSESRAFPKDALTTGKQVFPSEAFQ